MKIIDNQHFPKRKTFAEVVNPTKCLEPRRVRIVGDTMIRGVFIWTGSVFEFDWADPDGREDLNCLYGCNNKAERVPLDTPLFTAQAPPPPVPQARQDFRAQELAMLFLQEFAKQATELPIPHGEKSVGSPKTR